MPELPFREPPQLVEIHRQVVGVCDALEIAAQQVLFRPSENFAVFRIDHE